MSTPNRPAIGVRLREIRKRLGMTQGTFAVALGGCTREFISQIEHGKSAPSAQVVAGVERLGFSSQWLMSGEGEPQRAVEESAVMAADRPSEWARLPILGRVPAGFPGPSPVEEIAEGFFVLPHSMISDRDAFCLKVHSDSMAGVAEKGDLVVVSPSLRSSIKDNDLVVARLAGGDTFLKRFSRSDGRVVLLSSNPRFPPIIIDPGGSVTIIGKVLYTIHHYR